jgi:hypothetical protein
LYFNFIAVKELCRKGENMRAILKNLAILILAGISIYNVRFFGTAVSSFGPRETNDMVQWEARFVSLHEKLVQERYLSGKVNYITARSLKGEPMSDYDGPHWSLLRYIAIPHLLVCNDDTAPYVIANFTDGMKADVPANLVKIAESGDGLFLYKKVSLP